MDITSLISNLGRAYHLHVEVGTPYPEICHRQMIERFKLVRQLRCLRRNRPLYIRLTNIEERTNRYERLNYRYIIDYVSPSLLLLAELCNFERGTPELYAPKLSMTQILKCFTSPIDIECPTPGTYRFITRMHPLTLLNELLRAYPKSIESINFGLSHTLNMSPQVDLQNHFERDKMPFAYKRITKYQPIIWDYNL